MNDPTTASVLRSLSLFVIAGVCEIGGGLLMWKWLRDDKPGWWGLSDLLRRYDVNDFAASVRVFAVKPA